jgi:hypothetical protein
MLLNQVNEGEEDANDQEVLEVVQNNLELELNDHPQVEVNIPALNRLIVNVHPLKIQKDDLMGEDEMHTEQEGLEDQ